MPVLLKLFLTFLKIGAVSFGGGYGMISMIREKTLAHGWLTEAELLNMIAVAESTPGEILKRLRGGTLISIDRDPDAIQTLTQRFCKNENSIVVKGNFGDMREILAQRKLYRVDGVLLDIGVSSHQLDTAERGFSFHEDAPLDMRMSQKGTTAAELVNTLPFEELRRILFEYGEEKYAGSIAKGIIAAREEKPIETTFAHWYTYK